MARRIPVDCECDCFADHFFDPLGSGFRNESFIRFGDEWEKPFREGCAVYVVHNGQRYRIDHIAGHGFSSIVEMYPERRLLANG